MKFVNGLWWPDGEEHLLPYGLEYQKEVRDKAMAKLFFKRTCLDVGAHVGIASIHFSKHFEKVIAFEPVRPIYNCLRRNTRKINNIEIFNMAVSDKSELVYIEVGGTNTGNSIPHKEELIWARPVQATPLDAILDLTPKVDLIKVDVEGFEPYVLEGARQFIARDSPVIIVEVKGLGATKDNPERPLELLKEMGYTVTDKFSNDYIAVRA